MAKVPVSTSVEEELDQRLKLVARIDRRHLADVVRLAIEKGLPILEDELGPKLQETPVPWKGKLTKKAG